MDVNWPQLLQDYGPFALLPFALMAIERIAAKRALDHSLPEKIRNRVYASAWILIFVLCAAVVGFWFQNRPKAKEAMMRGRITGLGVQEQFRGSGPDTANVRVFTYRDPQETERLFWRVFSVDTLDERTQLSLYIDTSAPGSERTRTYLFKANRKFYDDGSEVLLTYDPMREAIVFDDPTTHHPQVLEAISKNPVIARGVESSSSIGHFFEHFPGFAVLLAQAQAAQTRVKPPVNTIIANLDSEDALVRLTARRQLAEVGAAAIPDMDEALVNAGSSYRVRLGVIVAANQMPDFALGFSPAAWCRVWEASQTGDDTLKTQASVLLRRQKKPVNVSSCASRRSAVQQVTASPAQRAPVATQPEVDLVDSTNIGEVINKPPRPPTFEITKPHLISYVRTYHWNNAHGQIGGTIALRNEKGQMFGPWFAYTSSGQGGAPNVNWEVAANQVIPPGKYTVIDSDPATWSWNKESAVGFAIVKGRPVQ